MPIKLDPDLPTVSSNNKSEVPAKKIRLLGSFAYKASLKRSELWEEFSLVKIDIYSFYVKSSRFNHASPRFRTNLFMVLPIWLVRVGQVCLFFSFRKLKPCFWKNIPSLVRFRKTELKMCFSCSFFFADECFFSWHCNFAFWSRNFVLRHFIFVVELKRYFWWHFNFTDFRYLENFLP